ncbi:MAG: hypothetical protein IRY87_23950 [Acetobacteraceae bacterium]|nr:hypothetical protein [Acetobacteraceae bacterium]
MQTPSYDHPHQQQINALVALVGALLGRLRADGALSQGEMTDLLRQADAFLPEGSESLGTRLLAVVRETQALAVADMAAPLDRRRLGG